MTVLARSPGFRRHQRRGVVLAMLPKFLLLFSTPFHLASTYDEEAEYHGANFLLQQLEVQNIHPALCIVGSRRVCEWLRRTRAAIFSE